MSTTDPEIQPTSKAELIRLAESLGFYRLGVARANRSPFADRYLEWLDRGHHAGMEYMSRQADRRADPRLSLEGARSVVVVTVPYFSGEPRSHDPSLGEAKIARYATRRDYHKVLKPRLKRLAAAIEQDGEFRTWISVDTGPILERDWAQMAGLGWIGKNALVIDPDIGSWFFLGVIVTDRDYSPDAPQTDHCGSCRACLDACPTDAFPEPRTVDANRCISYLTIEHRGEFQEEPATLADYLFGCDICQEVCPYNARRFRRLPPVDPDLESRDLLTNLLKIESLDRERFVEEYAGSPVMRARLDGLHRNAKTLRNGPKT